MVCYFPFKLIAILSYLIVFHSVLSIRENEVTSYTKNYEASCFFYIENTVLTPKNCKSALFSQYNYDIIGRVEILAEDDLLCETNEEECVDVDVNGVEKDTRDIIAVVRRGICNFEQKAIRAIQRKYKALVVVNSNDSVVAMGKPESPFNSSIPVVMIPNGDEFTALNTFPKHEITVQISLGKSANFFIIHYLLF